MSATPVAPTARSVTFTKALPSDGSGLLKSHSCTIIGRSKYESFDEDGDLRDEEAPTKQVNPPSAAGLLMHADVDGAIKGSFIAEGAAASTAQGAPSSGDGPPINENLRAVRDFKQRSSFPLTEVDALRQQLIAQKTTIEKLQVHNQQLVDEKEAYRQFLELANSAEPATTTTSTTPTRTTSMPVLTVVKVGYLMKQGLNWHNWCTRWCLLRSGTFTYFKTPSDQKPKGMFHVFGCEVEEYNDARHPHCFTVQSRNRLWYFAASSANELKAWINALKMASQEAATRPAESLSQSSDGPLNGKLFRFFGEQPSKDWEERVRKATMKKLLGSAKDPDPVSVSPEIAALMGEKELKLAEENELPLSLVYAHIDIFLNCAYFVTRERCFKQRIEELTAINGRARPPSPLTGAHRTGARRKPPGLSKESASGIYTDALGKILSLQNPRDTYTLMEKIGRGGFAEVYVGKHKKSKDMVAIKVLSQKFQKRNARMCHEVSMLMSSHHPNIIKNVQNYLFNEEIYMVTEYCEVGSIDRLLKFDLSEQAVAYIAREVLNGLNYMHGLGRVHRDIKCSNILLNQQAQIKIADLGLCEELKDGFIAGKMSGSKYWLAPEVIARKPYSTSADIWNVGALCSCLVAKMPPNGDMPAVKAMFLVAVKGVTPADVLPTTKEWTKEFQSFLEACFRLDPTTRPTCAELLQHPFVKKGKRSDIIAAINSCMITELII